VAPVATAGPSIMVVTAIVPLLPPAFRRAVAFPSPLAKAARFVVVCLGRLF
jgi:hypothetical protein